MKDKIIEILVGFHDDIILHKTDVMATAEAIQALHTVVSEEDLAQIFYHNVVRDEDGEIDVGFSAGVIAKRINELQSFNAQEKEIRKLKK